jgi:hypothetical protein
MGGMPTPKQKRRRSLEEEKWLRLLTAYREVPGNHSRAGEKAGVDRATARKFYEDGDPKSPWGARAIKAILFDEQRAAAAAVVSAAPLTSDEARAAKAAAIETRAAEGKLLRYARDNAQALLNLTTVLSSTALKLADRVRATLENPEFASGMTLAQALLTLNRIAAIAQRGIYAAESVTTLERQVLGDPNDRGARDADVAAISDADAIETLGRAADLAAELEKRGLTVLQGGRGKEIKLAPLEGPKSPETNTDRRPVLAGDANPLADGVPADHDGGGGTPHDEDPREGEEAYEDGEEDPGPADLP